MLLKYIVKNYKSIAHSIEYSMFPTEDNLESKYFIPLPTVQGTWKILRRGALLGPNASGKSNFIQSLDFARDYIVEAQKSGNKTGVPQFKGEFSDIGKNSTFQFMFCQNEDIFEYGFSLDEYRVDEEWLMILGKSTFEPIFQRMTDDNDPFPLLCMCFYLTTILWPMTVFISFAEKFLASLSALGFTFAMASSASFPTESICLGNKSENV